MVLEVEVGLLLAGMGLLGCLLFLVEGHVRRNPGIWAAFFLGVLGFDIIHDITDALLRESFIRSTAGVAVYIGLVGAGLILGWVVVPLVLKDASAEERWTPVLWVLFAVLALHAALDGFVVGSILQGAPVEEIVRPEAIGLQVLHRALEGGVLVAFMILAGMGRLRTFAAAFYVGLPLTGTVLLVGSIPFEAWSALGVLLTFAQVSAFLGLLLLGLWPTLSRLGAGAKSVKWLLLGFLVTLVAHSLAH